MKYKLALFAVFLSSIAYTQEPTIEEIETVANQFLNEKIVNLSFTKKSAQAYDIEDIRTIVENEQRKYTVVELSPKGFIVMSNHKAINPVIAYSITRDFNFSPDSHNVLHDLILKDISQRETYLTHQVDEADLWSEGAGAEAAAEEFQQWPEAGTTSTGGWIETTWHQGDPYNRLFPIDPVTNERVVTGCVSTALAQVLNYHGTFGEYPLNSVARYTSHGVNNATIRIDDDYLDADFASFVELNDILSTVKSKYDAGSVFSETEISAINFLAAIMVKANFTSYSTSANINNIPLRLLDYFQYESCDITSTISTDVFSSLINDMRLGLPALLSIQKQEGFGHLIVCDGYNTDEFFHLNFGWGTNSPEAISEVWYNIPQDIPADYTILNTVIHNINPYKKGIRTSKALIELFPIPSRIVSSFELFTEKDTTVDISCTDFIISDDSINFSTSLNSLDLASGVENTIWVKYEPADSLMRDYIAISLNDTIIEYVEVRAYPIGNTVDPGPVQGLWNNLDKPYLITGDIYVDSGNTLEIAEGVRVYFLDGAGLTVGEGSLIVKGSPQYPVLLTTLSEEDKWDGIDFLDSGSEDHLEHAIIMNSNSSGIDAINTDLNIFNCMFANNCSERGSGISLINSKSTISGCIIVNNYTDLWGSSRKGGGLYAENAIVEITNSTFSKNSHSNGGAIFASNSNIVLLNSIFWDNWSNSLNNEPSVFSHKEIAFDKQNTSVSASNCIISDLEDSDFLYRPEVLLRVIQAENVIDADPKFQKPSSSWGATINPLNNNWSLSRSSLAINNGTKNDTLSLLPTDYYGNPRVFLNELDIGAAECTDSTRSLTVTPLSFLEFPVTHTDSSCQKTIHLKNSGVGVIYISTNITNSSCFSADRALEQEILQPGDSLAINLTYMPQDPNQTDTAYFVLFTTAENYGYKRIRLTGTSVEGMLLQGAVSGVWSKEMGPYIITGDTWIKAEDSLVIQKGTEIYLTGNYSLSVTDNSVLSVQGAKNDTVRFTALDNWKGISFRNCSNMQNIHYSSITGVKNFSAITLQDSPIRIYNSQFQKNGICIKIENRNPVGYIYDIRDCEFQDNFHNIILYENFNYIQEGEMDTLLVIENEFTNNVVHTIIQTYSNNGIKLVIDSNSFSDNIVYQAIIDHSGRYYADQHLNNTITGNQIYKNTCYGIAGIRIAWDRLSICNNLIVQNRILNNWSGLFNLNTYGFELLNNTVAYNEILVPLLKSWGYQSNTNDSSDGAIIRNNIFFKNGNSDFEIEGNFEEINIDYNLCENQFAGSNNNFSVNPGFAGGQADTVSSTIFSVSDWYLADNSPCIDAGHPDTIYNDIANPENPSTALIPSKGTTTNDLGAFGGNNSNSFVSESVAICEGSDYEGHTNDGYYYKIVPAQNGRDSIVVLSLEVIRSDLQYMNPWPQDLSVIPGGQIEFSWDHNPATTDSLLFKVLYSADQRYWHELYSGYETRIHEDFDEISFSGKKISWYVINYDEYCPRKSPVWEFSIDMVTESIGLLDESTGCTIYPNPGNGKFTIRLGSDLASDLALSLYSASGQVVWKKHTIDPHNTQDIDLDVSAHGKGVYFLVGKSKKTNFSKKIIVL